MAIEIEIEKGVQIPRPNLRRALSDLLDASERLIFSTECQKERDAARAALGKARI